MVDHSVAVSRGPGCYELKFSPVFNVAVPFIDRHLDEGRAAKVAVRTADGDSVTYAELAERVARCGNGLKGLGLQRGDRVLMVVKDCAEFLYAFWGAIKAGLVPVPLNTLLRSDDYRYVIEDSEAVALVYSPEYAGEVEPAVAAAKGRLSHVLLAEGDGATLQSLIGASSADLEAAPAGPDDDCFWLYSSGSTGRPKGAVHAQRALVVTSQCYGVDCLGVREDDVCFSAAKLFFAYGLGNGMSFPLWAGASTVLFAGKPTPELTFDVIERFRPTLYFGVPTLYAAQLAALDQTSRDFSSLRYCISAGEALPAELYRRWQEKTGLSILDGIGSTEALHIFISNDPGDIKPGTTGRPVPGYEMRIVDERGEPVAQGQAGALHLRGASAASRYWNKPEKTAETMLPEDWLNTGDTYRQDEEGYFVYEGRSDDMLKVGGIWTSPIEIEARLIEHPKVLEAAVVGRPDRDELIKPEAWIILKDSGAGSKELEAELTAHVKQTLAPYKYPRWYRFVTELPKTATGKIQRYRLRATSR